ncbi:MAG: hypothetical protein II823_03585 [Kiritimatiellae bacterium]|nr:hypothetical protein [Kiritimatiellia bacterium]
MKKSILSYLVVAIAIHAFAFDISFGISGYDPILQQTLGTSSPWFDIVGYFASNQEIPTEDGSITGMPCLIARGSGEWSDMAFTFCPRRLNEDTDGLYVGTYSEKAWNHIATLSGAWTCNVISYLDPQDFYTIGTSGYSGSNFVFTISGDPYSVVYNQTSSTQTINGVTIPLGESRRLYLPLRLAYWPAWGEGNNKYYLTDLDGNAIKYNMQNYIGSNWRGCGVGWSGDFVIREYGIDYDTNTVELTEHLLFADVNSTNEYKLMYGETGKLVREGFQVVSTNIQLMTWWDFTQSEWGNPKAKINGEIVCNGHATTHIIPYTINNNQLVINEMTGKGRFEFIMSQSPESGKSGGSCVMRCWDASYGSNTADYERTPTDHKAEVSAGLDEAKFIFTVDTFNGTWKVEPN